MYSLDGLKIRTAAWITEHLRQLSMRQYDARRALDSASRLGERGLPCIVETHHRALWLSETYPACRLRVVKWGHLDEGFCQPSCALMFEPNL
jgi:hypothetical protein